MSNQAYRTMEQRVARWCETRSDIEAAIIVGSRGRSSGPADHLSDLDLIFFAVNQEYYQRDDAWLSNFGELWIATLNFIGPGHPEWMAFFSPGLKVDFLFAAASSGQSLKEMLDALPYPQILSRGFRLLYRADAHARESIDTSTRRLDKALPTEEELHYQLNSTLLTANRFVKFAIREDTWRSRYTFHAELMNQLLALAEWHAQVTSGPELDTWHEGRDLRSWADVRFLHALKNLNPGYDFRQQCGALTAFLELMDMLVTEVAAQLDFTYPTTGQRQLIAHLKATMRRAEERGASSP